MVFPSDWPQPTSSNHQQHHHQQHQLQENGGLVSGNGSLLTHQLSPLPVQNPNPNNHHASTTNSGGGIPARLGGSMAERARQARIQPEGALNCPRCQSTNTKFCYYNNYNLNQPRHFCKGCRRYWTRGGALRNVPVGGGCRRNNKKGKNGNSKSSSSNKQTSTVNGASPSSGQLRTNHQQFPFLPTLHNLTQLGGIGLNLAATNGNNNQAHHHQIGSGLMNDLGFLHHVGNGRDNNENNLMASHFALFDPTTGLYAFQNEGNIGISSSPASMVDSRVYQTAAPVKMEEQPNNLINLSKPVSGLTSPHQNQTNQYFWNNADFSGPSSNDHDDHHQLL